MLNASVWWMNIETDVKFKGDNIPDQKINTRIDPFCVYVRCWLSFLIILAITEYAIKYQRGSGSAFLSVLIIIAYLQ